ncbi:hypothetical protein THOM_2590 [Trachipleistophora hominis]|uniref:Uncharacterized protein n=1 Tax=Trachipleistophora hominis TaxID=72359 RepID=L7JT48_TRAHO|nr:hypothetical protein THOM_2590 [Trachipleistophora hominis]
MCPRNMPAPVQAQPADLKFDQNNEFKREEYFKSQAKRLLAQQTYKLPPDGHTGPLLKSKNEIMRLENLKKAGEAALMRVKEKGRKFSEVKTDTKDTKEHAKTGREKRKGMGDAIRKVEQPKKNNNKSNNRKRRDDKNTNRKRMKK